MNNYQDLAIQLGGLNREKLQIMNDNNLTESEKNAKLQSLMDQENSLILQFKQSGQQSNLSGNMNMPTGGLNNINSFMGNSGSGLGGGLSQLPAAAGGEAGQGGLSGLGQVTQSGGGGGIGGLGIGAIIAAVIAAQHGLSGATDRTYEGVETKDVFSGHFGTEPWFAYLLQQLGIDEATFGEKFDAAIANKDWGKAAKRLPGVLDYWTDPARTQGTTITRKYLGNTLTNIIDPLSWLVNKF